MVSKQSVRAQLKKIQFNYKGWGRSEAGELPAILLEDEEIYECVNGIYDGGFALLVATDVRLLLIDKKPLNYLTVEDLRFDMINEIDYNHRLFGAYVSVSTGYKDLHFTSINQPRLRKLIGHVQHCMAETKKKQTEHQEDQNQHLEQINRRLEAYLTLTQRQQQSQWQHDLSTVAAPPAPPQPHVPAATSLPPLEAGYRDTHSAQLADIYAEGVKEVFGRQSPAQPLPQPEISTGQVAQPMTAGETAFATAAVPSSEQDSQEINALEVAYSKLPLAMRNRRFGRPSFHAHSQTVAGPQPVATATGTY